jgi:hypothetical protein
VPRAVLAEKRKDRSDALGRGMLSRCIYLDGLQVRVVIIGKIYRANDPGPDRREGIIQWTVRLPPQWNPTTPAIVHGISLCYAASHSLLWLFIQYQMGNVPNPSILKVSTPCGGSYTS